jgi:putative cell wall-binding protein
MTARSALSLPRLLAALLAVGVAIALVPVGPARAAGEPVLSRAAVGTGEDFASMAYGDPWDFDNAADITFHRGRTEPPTVNPRLEGGELRFSARGGASLLTFVFPGYGGALYMDRDGGAKPIDADRYTHLAMQIFSPSDRAMSFSFDRCLAAEGTTGFCRASTANVILRAGWNTVDQDLRALTAGSSQRWAGKVYAFRMMNDVADGYRVRYVRLQTAPETVDVTWDRSQGDTLYWVRGNADTSGGPGSSPDWGVVGSGGRASFPAGAYEAGSYRLAAGNGRPGAGGTPLRIAARPAPFVLDPDLAGGEDYATSVLGKPWDFTSPNDIIARGNWVGGFGSTGLNGENAANDPARPAINDPYFYLRMHPTQERGALDANRFHRLTVETTYQGPFNLEDVAGGGTHGRLLWTRANRDQDRVIQGNKLIESREMVHYPGQASFTVDLKTPEFGPAFVMETDRPERDGWSTGSPITHLRYDPNEDRGPRRWNMRRISLRATDASRGGAFTVRWKDPSGATGVRVALHYRPESGGEWREIATGVEQVAGENSFRWSSAGVPAGRYVVRVTATDGVSAASGISSGPVDMRPTIRVAGGDRLATGVALSRTAFPQGAPAAVLARADQFPDALAAAPLAAAAGGPLLLNTTGELAPAVRDELRRLQVRTVYVMGGTSAQADAVLAQVRALGSVEVTRISGTDRFQTGAAAAEEAVRLWREQGHADAGSRVLVARGSDFPDALAAGPLAGQARLPLLLTDADRAHPATLAALDRLGARRVTIVGGVGAVNEAAQRGLGAGGRSVDRIAGRSRHETAELAAGAAVRAGASDKVVIVASGRAFPDALAAGPAVGALGGVLLTTEPGELPGVTGAWINGRKPFRTLRIAGGAAAVADSVENEIIRLSR